MDDIKQEKLEKTCKKEKDHKVRIRKVAVRMVHVLNMSVDETASTLVHCPTRVRDWLRRYDEGGLEGLRDLPRCSWSRRISCNVMDSIIVNVVGCRITPPQLRHLHHVAKPSDLLLGERSKPVAGCRRNDAGRPFRHGGT